MQMLVLHSKANTRHYSLLQSMWARFPKCESICPEQELHIDAWQIYSSQFLLSLPTVTSRLCYVCFSKNAYPYPKQHTVQKALQLGPQEHDLSLLRMSRPLCSACKQSHWHMSGHSACSCPALTTSYGLQNRTLLGN